MRKLILISFFAFLLVGCNDKKTKIELPDGLSWGMTVNDINAVNIELENIPTNKTLYRTKIEPFKLLTITDDKGLVMISSNENFYLGEDGLYEDPLGEQAIKKYTDIVSRFSEKYVPENKNNPNLSPSKEFWNSDNCKGNICYIDETVYKDDDDTILSLKIALLKHKQDQIGMIIVTYKNKQFDALSDINKN